jgi:hypothetical protein
MVFEGLVGLGVAILLGLALAEYGKWRSKAEKGWNWLAVAGVWFIFAAALPVVPALSGVLVWGTYSVADIFSVIGWIFALIGTLLVAYELLVEK